MKKKNRYFDESTYSINEAQGAPSRKHTLSNDITLLVLCLQVQRGGERKWFYFFLWPGWGGSGEREWGNPGLQFPGSMFTQRTDCRDRWGAS